MMSYRRFSMFLSDSCPSTLQVYKGVVPDFNDQLTQMVSGTVWALEVATHSLHFLHCVEYLLNNLMIDETPLMISSFT